jgi:hypothetical protein
LPRVAWTNARSDRVVLDLLFLLSTVEECIKAKEKAKKTAISVNQQKYKRQFADFTPVSSEALKTPPYAICCITVKYQFIPFYLLINNYFHFFKILQ